MGVTVQVVAMLGEIDVGAGGLLFRLVEDSSLRDMRNCRSLW
jgi:hypothetical protein